MTRDSPYALVRFEAVLGCRLLANYAKDMNNADRAGSPGASEAVSGAARSQVARVVRQLEAQTQASPSPPARSLRSASHTLAAPASAPAPRQSVGRKHKTRQQPTTAPTDPADASGFATAAPAPPPTWAEVVAGTTTCEPGQIIRVLVSEVEGLRLELSQARAFGVRTYDQLQQNQQANTERLEHLHRHSKRNNLVVFGVPESAAYSTPAKLASHMQGVLFQTAPATELSLVRSAFRLGRWKPDQHKPRAVLVELLSVAAKHTAFQASSRLRTAGIRLDEDLTPVQMKQRRGLSTDFQCLKARGYKPFFRGVTLKYRDGAVIRKCGRGEANKVVAAAAQAARATAPVVTRPQPARRTSVAMDQTEVSHRSGVSVLGQLSDPLVSVAQAAQAAAGEGLMDLSDDEFGG